MPDHSADRIHDGGTTHSEAAAERRDLAAGRLSQMRSGWVRLQTRDRSCGSGFRALRQRRLTYPA